MTNVVAEPRSALSTAPYEASDPIQGNWGADWSRVSRVTTDVFRSMLPSAFEQAFDHSELTERLLEQEYFWTSEWQEAEREADEDIKAGRIRRFSNAQEAIVHLRSLGT